MSNYCCDIQCPFYMGETDNAISCEGPEPKTKVKYIFAKSKRKTKRQHRLECCERWPNECPIAKMLIEQWEGKDE